MPDLPWPIIFVVFVLLCIVKSSLKALKAKTKEALENTVMRQLSKKKDAAEGTMDIGKFLDQEKYVLMFIYIIQSFVRVKVLPHLA